MKKLFILCPYVTTGGPQTLHQLVDKLNNLKLLDAYIVYSNKSTSVLEQYKNYNIKVANTIEDDEDNILIVPETMTHYLKKYKKIKKIIWWLSLDFFKETTFEVRYNRLIKTKKIPKLILPLFRLIYSIFSNSTKMYKFDDNNKYFHLYNCEYIRLYLEEKGIKEENMSYLCGPIREEYLHPKKIQRNDFIVYNPKKGIEYTEKIINYFKSKNSPIKFIKLENMTYHQIIEILNKSKVYIDFGFFPGPERVPREAVSMGCCIITGLVGSSVNDIDVPIPKKYKFDREELDLELIYNSINELINNYDNHYNEFGEYRKKVKGQIDNFENNIKTIFETIL